jgi:hypothetical protein
MKKTLSPLVVLGLALLTSCSTQRSAAKAEPRFYDCKHADIIVRYYTDSLSRIVQPVQMEGPFLTDFDKDGVLQFAKQQNSRDLAVVVLLKFNCAEPVRQSWLSRLTNLGYKRVVFLRAENGRKLDGLCILPNPTQLSEKPQPPAKEHQTETVGG